jgi:hypothetical protein
MMTAEHVADDRRFEYQLSVSEGFSIPASAGGLAGSWFGTNVRYRVPSESRRWRSFNLVEVHTWELPKITRALEAHYHYDKAPA